MKKSRKELFISLGALFVFVLFTVAVKFVDVKAIGPEGSLVGFATLNYHVHEFVGVHMPLYVITDWLGLVPIIIVVFFALFGLLQSIRRKSIAKVDYDILVLGVYYVIVVAVFLLFEKLAVNFRPVLIDGVLEASYPSSTTMLTMCVMPTCAIQISKRVNEGVIKKSVKMLIYFFTAFMVVARLVSGVHWFTDIIGGILVSIGLVYLYAYFSKLKG